MKTIDHPSYSPNLSPTDYHLFRNLDNFLQGNIFNSQQAVKNAFRAFIDSRSSGFYAKGINELPLKWQKCINASGIWGIWKNFTKQKCFFFMENLKIYFTPIKIKIEFSGRSGTFFVAHHICSWDLSNFADSIISLIKKIGPLRPWAKQVTGQKLYVNPTV